MLDSRSRFPSAISTDVEKLWIFKKIGRSRPMNLWKQVLDRLEQSIDRTEYENWFVPTRFLAQKGDTIDVGVPTQRFIDTIRDRYASQIRSVLDELSTDRLNLHLIAERQEPGAESAPQLLPVAAELPASIFNPRYRFETFVVGKSNELAFAASKSIAENPSGSFNPLFIYGGAGLGKTHLIQAIGQEIRAKGRRLKVVYMSADSFVTELITSIRYDRMQQFRDRYRSVDALLLDDIQFLAGKERTQEEFFHTFNALYEAQKQIVFTSDAPPKDIPTLEERLRSRFEWGLIADIQPPDLETKMAILQRKAEGEKIDLPHDVCTYIAQKTKSNVRELEGALVKLTAFSSLTHVPITISMAQQVLRDLLQKQDRRITIDSIQKAVAERYSIKPAQLKEKSNRKEVVVPRQVAMYLVKELTHASLPEIGRAFGGKHHTTVIHSVAKIDAQRAADMDLNKLINSLIDSFQ